MIGTVSDACHLGFPPIKSYESRLPLKSWTSLRSQAWRKKPPREVPSRQSHVSEKCQAGQTWTEEEEEKMAPSSTITPKRGRFNLLAWMKPGW